MRIARIVAAFAAISFTAPALAWQQCPQKTLGDVFLDYLDARLNDGLRPQDYWQAVPGMQLHLDSSSAPPPAGSFFKPPAAWRMAGTDTENRLPLGPMVFPVAENSLYLLQVRLHDINLAHFGVEFDCDPTPWGGALSDGGLSQEWRMSPAGDPNIDVKMGFHLRFRICAKVCIPYVDCWTVCLISVDEWVTTSFIEVDLDRDFSVMTSIAPKLSADRASIDVQGFVDAHEAVNQALVGELYDDAAEVGAIVAGVVCAPWIWNPICVAAVVITAVAVLDAYEDDLRALGNEKMQSAFGDLVNDLANRPPAGSPPGTTGNQLLKTAIDKFRQRVRSLQIPERVATIRVPDFDDVVPFDPLFAPTCQ